MTTFIERYYEYIANVDTEEYPDEEQIIPYLERLDRIHSKPVHGYNQFFEATIKKYNLGRRNRCTECHKDMGISNPRQKCGKYYCETNEFS